MGHSFGVFCRFLMQLSVVIVNYNVKYFLEQCIASVRNAITGLQAEVWVADNASTDGTLAYLQPLFPDVHFLPLAQNIGFARGNNEVLPHCKGRYILFLNPDTIVAEDSLHKMVAFMDDTPAAGAMGVRMIDGSGRYLPESKRGFPSPLTSLYKQLGLHLLFPHSRRFARYYLGHLPAHSTCVAEVLAGACMLVRHKVLEEVGSFDERFFMYGEDVDLSYRIAKAGWKNYYFAETTILHFKGESAGQMGWRYYRVFYEAMQLFVRKHYNGTGARAFRLLLYLGITLRAMAALFWAPFRYVLAQQRKTFPNPLVLQETGWPQHIAFPAAICSGEERIQIMLNQNSKHRLLAVGHNLTVAEALQLMEGNAESYHFWLHGTKTNSVVSSESKTATGRGYLFCR